MTDGLDLDAVRHQALAALETAVPEPIMFVLVLAHEMSPGGTAVVLSAGNCDGTGVSRLLRDAAGMWERSQAKEHPTDRRPA